MSLTIELTLLGRPTDDEIAGAARSARPAGWDLAGPWRLTVRGYVATAPREDLAGRVAVALADVLIARGARVTRWLTLHDPDARGERLEVKLERVERSPAAPPRPAPLELFTPAGAGADWATDPNGQGEHEPRPGRGLRGGSAMATRGRAPRTIAVAIRGAKL